MADEFDPILEARLRGVLREEAASVPFTLRTDTVRRVGAERRRARNMQRLTLMSAAAVVVVAVAGVFLTLNLRNSSNVATSPSPNATATAAPSASASASGEAPSTGPSASASGDAAFATMPADLSSNADLLAAAGQGAVQLQADESAAVDGAATVQFDQVNSRVSVAVVVACFGSDITVTDSTMPAGSDPAGTATCDGKPHLVTWDGWGRMVDAGPAPELAVPSHTSYRAMVVDTSAVAFDGEDAPVADGLPTVAHMTTQQASLATAVASSELLSPTATPAQMQVADIRGTDFAQLLLACHTTDGSSATASIVTMSAAGATSPVGSATCDGTVQAFLWTRPKSSDAAAFRIDSPANVAWRAAVMAGFPGSLTGADTSVGCRTASASLKGAPTTTLEQGGAKIGTVSYYTETWNGTSSDGVPTTPATANEAAAGTPMTIVLAGDVCAGRWSALYGPAKTDGTVGIDSVGVLAIGNPGATSGGSIFTANRLTIPALPSGDWVVLVDLTFEQGDAHGVIRVHVP